MALNKNKLSRKKQKNLRNVLVLSDKTFCPVLSENDSFLLNNKLKICLAPVKISNPRAPRHLLRSLNKEERLKKQEEILKQQPSEKLEAYYKALDLRKYLFIGVNALCRGIENRMVASCILDADISPKELVNHLIDLAVNSKVPILAIHNLKKTMNCVLGFSSLVLGFQKSVEDDSSNVFHDTCCSILEMEKLLASSDPFSVKEDVKQIILDSTLETRSVIPYNDIEDHLSLPELFKDIYLYRKSEDSRVFKPVVNVTMTSSADEDEEQNKNEMKLTFDAEIVNKIACKKQRYYKSLIVNKIQSNPLKKKKNKHKKK